MTDLYTADDVLGLQSLTVLQCAAKRKISEPRLHTMIFGLDRENYQNRGSALSLVVPHTVRGHDAAIRSGTLCMILRVRNLTLPMP